MQVLYDEGVATHIGPESCVAYQRVGVPRASPKVEVRREALTGERAGQPLSRERVNRGADDVQISEGDTVRRKNASATPAPRGRRPWHARTLLVREPGGLRVGRQQLAPDLIRGPDQRSASGRSHRP